MPDLTDHPERHQGDVVILRSWFQKGMLRNSAKQMIECARQDLGGRWQAQMIGMWIDAEYEMSIVCGGQTALLAKKAMAWSKSFPNPEGYKLNTYCPWPRYTLEAHIAKEAEKKTPGQSEATQADILILRVWFRRGMLTGFCKKMMKHLRDQKLLDGKFWKDERITNFVRAEKKLITVHGGEEARVLEAANLWAGLRGNRNPDPDNWFPWDHALTTDRHTVIRVKSEEPVGFTFQLPITTTAAIEPKTEEIGNDSNVAPRSIAIQSTVTPQFTRVTRSMATQDQRTIYATGQAAVRASIDLQKRRDRQAEIEELERREQAARELEWNAVREARLGGGELEEVAWESQREAGQEVLPHRGQEEHMQHVSKVTLHDQELLLQQEAAKELHDYGVGEDDQELRDVQDAVLMFPLETMMHHQQANLHVAVENDPDTVTVDARAVITIETQGQEAVQEDSALPTAIDPPPVGFQESQDLTSAPGPAFVRLSEGQVQPEPVVIPDSMATTIKRVDIHHMLSRVQPFGSLAVQQARNVVDISKHRGIANADQANALVPQTNFMVMMGEDTTRPPPTTDILGAAGRREESLTLDENTADPGTVMRSYPVANIPDARSIASRSTEVMLTVVSPGPLELEEQLEPTNKGKKRSRSRSRSRQKKRKHKNKTRAALKAVSDLGLLPQGAGTAPAGNITVINFHAKRMKVRNLFATPGSASGGS